MSETVERVRQVLLAHIGEPAQEQDFHDAAVAVVEETALRISDGLVFKCDEAACKKDRRFYEAFDMDERWEIIRAILAASAWEKMKGRFKLDEPAV